MLDGYGPIPASIASRLMAESSASFHRVLTDPRDGAPLEIGRTSYRIPAAMRQWLRLRDGRCPFPGCANQSLDNEADHLLAWAAGGATVISNLGQPCPKHHRLKHTTAWTPTGAGIDKPPGWISPTGRRYASEEQDWEPAEFPSQILGLLSDRLSPGLPEAHHQKRGNSVTGLPCLDRDRDSALPEDTTPRDTTPRDTMPEGLLPQDPLPEWVWQQRPLEEPDPDPYQFPPDYLTLPDDQRPGDHLPDRPLPARPFPGWALFLAFESLGV